ncbi:MAG TPA: hypothetical protein VHT01_05305, partial [Candidatus Udaeobacter sp.]|nr:hypothetical protein [Candidatus Udaeobacter sp.]
LQSRSRESGFKPPMSNAHLTIYRAVKLNRVNPIGSHYAYELRGRQTMISGNARALAAGVSPAISPGRETLSE